MSDRSISGHLGNAELATFRVCQTSAKVELHMDRSPPALRRTSVFGKIA
jgi:hypothetical protein